MARRRVVPSSPDRPPSSTDNPRHAIWIEDGKGLRRITAANPGSETIKVGITAYTHTRETDFGQWVYTRGTA